MGRRNKRGRPRPPEGVKVLVRNRRVFYDYDVSETLEAGLALQGSEVKSLRESRASLADGHVEVRGGQGWLVGVQINPYPWANQFNHEPFRRRKLLLHRRELARLEIKTSQRGFTLVPISFYLKDGKIKLELGVARGKRQYEKRASEREAEDQKEMDRGRDR